MLKKNNERFWRHYTQNENICFVASRSVIVILALIATVMHNWLHYMFNMNTQSYNIRWRLLQIRPNVIGTVAS